MYGSVYVVFLGVVVGVVGLLEFYFPNGTHRNLLEF